MRPFLTLSLVCLAPLLLAACSGKPHPDGTLAAAASPASAHPAAAGSRVGTPFDTLIADKKRAQHVQQIIDQQAKKQRQQIDDESH